MRTLLKRSDLLQEKKLNRQEIEILDKWRREIKKILVKVQPLRHEGTKKKGYEV
jgi:hypothetical protein